MSFKDLDLYDETQLLIERNQKAVRGVSLIQRAQYSLSLQEQRFLLYCISKVKPDDTELTEYTVELKDYLAVCGIRGTSTYKEIKDIIINFFSKMVIALETQDEKGNTYTTVTNWFSYIQHKKGDGTIKFKFSEKVSPYLLRLADYNAKAEDQNKLFYVSDEIKYMLPFRCRFSYYLYPLLRSYQNNHTWTFDIEPNPDRPLTSLRELMDVYERLGPEESYMKAYGTNKTLNRKALYPRYVDFRRYVLEPAIRDINEFSNISVVYKPRKKGRSVQKITFFFENKCLQDRIISETRGRLALDKSDATVLPYRLDIPEFDPEGVVEFHSNHDLEPDTIPPSIYTKLEKRPTTAKEIREFVERKKKEFEENASLNC